MLLGIDVSTYFDVLSHGGQFPEGDPLDAFRENGVDTMRIRLWVDPYSPEGEPYLGGGCDLPCFLAMGKLAREKGFDILLDLHYSDFWADPGKQMIPKAWQGQSLEELTRTVYRYTRETLEAIREAGLPLRMIQVGNEITNGFLWPLGRLGEETEEETGERVNYPAFIKLLKAGIQACQEIYPEAERILHLERSFDWPIYREFFTKMEQSGVDYQIIGASYYPFWHRSFDEFFYNMEQCRVFGKKRMVMETGYAFTLEDYKAGEGGLVVSLERGLPEDLPYPLTEDGQEAYLKEFMRRCREQELDGVFYWEPLWLPGEGICWASEAGQSYIHEEGKPTRNEWSNQCLVDYQGRRLKGFEAFQ